MGLFRTRKKTTPPSAPASGITEAPASSPPPPALALAEEPRSVPSVSQQPFQPVEILGPPPGWNGLQPVAPPPPPPYQDQRQYPPTAPIIVNHYYLGPSSHHGPPNSCSHSALRKLKSVADLANDLANGNIVNHVFDDGLPSWHCPASQLLNQSAAMYDQILQRFNDVMTLIDREKYAGNEKDLFTYQPVQPSPASVVSEPPPVVDRSRPRKHHRDAPKGQTTAVASSLISGGYFAKVELYANSRLPMNLPSLQLYIPTYPLLCLAAQYSERVYERPRGAERDAHVESDWRTGAKAMCIKSVPMDHMNTIVFAIRGTATFMDWAVNLNSAPTSPTGFLDDTGNFVSSSLCHLSSPSLAARFRGKPAQDMTHLSDSEHQKCHAGFLSVARKMIKPVAARLRQLLEEYPGRSSYSLLITGHSAGGAVASLLYSHMLATSRAAASELNLLTGCFKRVHCITFGTPPISLLPLMKPDRPELKKSLFLSFVNEGDPVARADRAYVKSLLELFAAPAPGQSKESSRKHSTSSSSPPSKHSKPREKKSKSALVPSQSKSSMKSSQSSGSKSLSRSSSKSKPVWQVPPSTLSNAGRIVVLRSGDPTAKVKGKKTVEERLNEGVVAQITSDEQLRGVVWGDPVCHVMKLYAGRIETLAVGAVTVKGR